jgi:hypothetical protein
MPRVYKTKGDQAKTAKVTVPLTPAMLALLQNYASVRHISYTAAARVLIEAGLQAPAQERAA